MVHAIAARQLKVLIRVRQAVRHVEEFSCSLADYLERRKDWGFSWNNIVMSCGLGLHSPRLPSREAKGIHLSHGSVQLLLVDGLMHGMIPDITKYLSDSELLF